MSVVALTPIGHAALVVGVLLLVLAAGWILIAIAIGDPVEARLDEPGDGFGAWDEDDQVVTLDVDLEQVVRRAA